MNLLHILETRLASREGVLDFSFLAVKARMNSLSRAMSLALLVAFTSGDAVAASQTPIRSLQKWAAGWDIFTEPLDLVHSNIFWSVDPYSSTLTVSFSLVNATPNKLYQMSINFFCTTFPANFGQFPTAPPVAGGGACVPETRQGVTASVAPIELGVVTTDMYGNGAFEVEIGPIAKGTYSLEFIARAGAGCNLTGGLNTPANCGADFQSPGPIYGDATKITLP